MKDPVRDVERIRGLLAAAGHTWTRPRAEVLRILIGAPTPLKVEEIHERLVPGAGRGVNLSSVYRTLHLLKTLRVVRSVQLGDGALRYELDEGYRDHHHHLVCEACGRIEDVRACPVEGVDLGAAVRSHSLELYGFCRLCAPKSSKRRSAHVRS